MIEGLGIGTEAWKALKAWAEGHLTRAQNAVNDRATTFDETQYQRGRRDLAVALLEDMKPEEVKASPPRKARDGSGY